MKNFIELTGWVTRKGVAETFFNYQDGIQFYGNFIRISHTDFRIRTKALYDSFTEGDEVSVTLDISGVPLHRPWPRNPIRKELIAFLTQLIKSGQGEVSSRQATRKELMDELIEILRRLMNNEIVQPKPSFEDQWVREITKLAIQREMPRTEVSRDHLLEMGLEADV